MSEIDWGPILVAAAGGISLLVYALRRFINYIMGRIEKADEATQQRITELEDKVGELETNISDMELIHATDRQQWEKDRVFLKGKIEALEHENEQLRESVKVLETAYNGSEARAIALEKRVAQLEAEIDKKNAAIIALRERLHRAEIELAEAKKESEIYREQNKEQFDLLRRYQQVQLAAPVRNKSEHAA